MLTGLSPAQVFLHIVLPQTWRITLPPLGNYAVGLVKDTSLVAIISVPELSYVALQLRAQTYRILEVLTAMAALYWLMGYPQAKLVDWIHRRYRVAE